MFALAMKPQTKSARLRKAVNLSEIEFVMEQIGLAGVEKLRSLGDTVQYYANLIEAMDISDDDKAAARAQLAKAAQLVINFEETFTDQLGWDR